jgi:hypothetical protein
MSRSTCSSRCRTWHGAGRADHDRTPRGRPDRGVALPGVLLLSALLVAVTGWLIGHVRTDLAMARATDAEDHADRLAQAALEVVAMALASVADWHPVNAITVPLPCPTAPRPVAALDVPAVRVRVQAAIDAASRWGPDTPRFEPIWICHAEAVQGQWLIPGEVPAVVVLLADDPEGDGRPDLSANQRLLLRAVVHGAAGTTSGASATVTRDAAGAAVVLASFRREW